MPRVEGSPCVAYFEGVHLFGKRQTARSRLSRQRRREEYWRSPQAKERLEEAGACGERYLSLVVNLRAGRGTITPTGP